MRCTRRRCKTEGQLQPWRALSRTALQSALQRSTFARKSPASYNHKFRQQVRPRYCMHAFHHVSLSKLFHCAMLESTVIFRHPIVDAQLMNAPFAPSTMFALLLASMNKSLHSSTSATSMLCRPFTLARMLAGVSNCRAYRNETFAP